MYSEEGKSVMSHIMQAIWKLQLFMFGPNIMLNVVKSIILMAIYAGLLVRNQVFEQKNSVTVLWVVMTCMDTLFLFSMSLCPYMNCRYLDKSQFQF